MEEEARLFYVACTRAKKVLVLPYANYSGNNPALPSRFFSRLLEDPQKDSSGEADVGNIRLYPGLMIDRCPHPPAPCSSHRSSAVFSGAARG